MRVTKVLICLSLLPVLKHITYSPNTFESYHQVSMMQYYHMALTWMIFSFIFSYLEMALNGPLDTETRENLSRSHSASKACSLYSYIASDYLIDMSYPEFVVHNQRSTRKNDA